jgi:Zn-finger nucleic acid-binding protein
MTERQSIEIDYCPRCRGVWLDRGELDKIIERSSARSSEADSGSRDYVGNRRHEGENDKHGHKSHGRKSFFSELFD